MCAYIVIEGATVISSCTFPALLCLALCIPFIFRPPPPPIPTRLFFLFFPPTPEFDKNPYQPEHFFFSLFPCLHPNSFPFFYRPQVFILDLFPHSVLENSLVTALFSSKLTRVGLSSRPYQDVTLPSFLPCGPSRSRSRPSHGPIYRYSASPPIRLPALLYRLPDLVVVGQRCIAANRISPNHPRKYLQDGFGYFFRSSFLFFLLSCGRS